MKYIKDKRNILSVAAVFALGLLLIFIGGGNKTSSEIGNDIEEKLSAACSAVEGVGECEVLVYYSSDDKGEEGTVESVIVICDGADSIDVRATLTSMLSSFFGIGSNRIKIEKLKSEG